MLPFARIASKKGEADCDGGLLTSDGGVLFFPSGAYAGGLCTVFVPSAPTPAAGAIYYLTEDRVKLLDVPVSTAMGCIMRLGIGSHELFDSRPQLVAELVRYNAPHGEPSR